MPMWQRLVLFAIIFPPGAFLTAVAMGSLILTLPCCIGT